jgi:hypothetical protein
MHIILEMCEEQTYKYTYIYTHTQGVQGGKVNILGGHTIGHFKQKIVYVHVSYSDRFLR